MTALYDINAINLPHVNLYSWAKKNKIIVPLDLSRTPEREQMFLKIQALRQFFVKLSPAEEAARFTEAMKEAMQYLPSSGFSDKTVIVFQVAGTVFFAVIYFMSS